MRILSLPTCFSWHGVVTAPTPWMASEYPPDSQPRPLEGSIFRQCLTGIFRTSGSEPARRWRERTDAPLVEEDGQHEKPLEQFAQGTHEHTQHLSYSTHNFSLILVRIRPILSCTSLLSRNLSSSQTNAMTNDLSVMAATFSSRMCFCKR